MEVEEAHQQECKIIGFDEESSESSTPDLCLSDQSDSFLNTNWRPYSNTTIFEHNTQAPADNNHKLDTCIALQRLLTSLYYNTITNQKVFYEFMDTVYQQQIFDDCYHLITYHQNQLTEIHSIISSEQYQLKLSCNLSQCEFSTRHLKINRKNIHHDQNVNIYTEIIDSFHFYLYHLYDAKFRISPNPDTMNADETSTNDHFDGDFYRMRKMVRGSKNDRNRSRYFNKFYIGRDLQTDSMEAVNQEIAEDTFLHYIASKLSMPDIGSASISKFHRLIVDEEYDTESLDKDLEIFKMYGVGNISQHIQNDIFMQQLVELFKISKGDSWSFSIGIAWNYWNGKDPFRSWLDTKVTKEYVVHPKYENFKEEILNYPQLKRQQYEYEILAKAQQFIKTNIVKSLVLRERISHIKEDKMSVDNLISLILYCDYSELSSDFTRSFRRLQEFELFKRIKKRNAKYWYFSKILHETVTYFGQYNGNYGANGLLPKLKVSILLWNECGFKRASI